MPEPAIFRKLRLDALEGSFAIVRLRAAAGLPGWSTSGGFFSITRTETELSIVADQSNIPDLVEADRGWHCWRIAGTFDLSTETGVIASVAGPLAAASIGIFVLSTFETDYVLVKHEHRAEAARILGDAGHSVDGPIKALPDS